MTWTDLFDFERTRSGDGSTVECIIGVMSQSVSCNYGLSQAGPVMIWTTDRVYFACEYDGLEVMRSVPRNPSYIFTHVSLETQ